MRIGIVGLGTMGSAAARNLERAGHEFWVHDIRPDAGSELLANGAHWAANPAAGSVDSCIRGDMILFVGGTDDDVAQVRPCSTPPGRRDDGVPDDRGGRVDLRVDGSWTTPWEVRHPTETPT